MKFNTLTINLKGAIPSGKNSVIVTREGYRIPSPRFKKWRSYAIPAVQEQLGEGFETLDGPCSIGFKYIAPDRRRRDIPGIIDSVYHILERAGVVTDDFLLGGRGGNITFECVGFSRESPNIEIKLVWWGK